ncbi:hypothetical protein AB8Z38_06795 [Bradyrhizobium sp. LLZ17]|uniref:Uncharacterized protein n=1 Tax=Bradyrhizobium sp. LLZ17 TaxID=3239388 RepID=A0AB39XMI5_9BRAD
MKAYNTVIVWTPNSEHVPAELRGHVSVRSLQSCRDWTKPAFARTCGAVEVSRRNHSADNLAKIFVDFHTLIVRDGIDPQAAHRAFLAIDEYRKTISHDIEGSE